MEGRPTHSVSILASWRIPVFVFLLAATVRVLFALHPTPDTPTDSAFYSKLADQILSGNFLLRGKDPFFNPGYPYWLALWRGIGLTPTGVRILQGITAALALGVLSAWILRLHGRLWAVLLGGLIAFAPTFAAHETEFLGETFALPFAVAAFWCSRRFEAAQTPDDVSIRRPWSVAKRAAPGWPRALVFGLVCGAAALFRPNLLFGAALVAAWLFVQATRKQRTLALVLAFVSGVGLFPALWMARNLALGHGLQAFSAHGGYILYLGNHEDAPGTVTVPPGANLANADNLYTQSKRAASHRTGRELTPAEADRYWYGQVLRFWFLQPAQALAVMWKKARLLVSNMDLGDVLLLDSYDSRTNFFAKLPNLDGFLIGAGLVGLFLSRKGSLYRLWAAGAAASVVVYFVTSRQKMWAVAALAPFLPEVGSLFPLRKADSLGKWIPRGLLAVLLVLPLMPPAVEIVDTTRISEARRLMRQGHPAEALALLEKETLPVAAYWFTRGSALERLDRALDARAAYRTGLRVDPGDVACLYRLGFLAQQEGDLPTAREWFQRVLEIDGQNPHALVQIARIEMTEGHAPEAVRLLETARNVEPDSADIHRHLGFAYLAAARWEDAATEFENLLRANPDDAELQMGLRHARERNRE